MLEEMLCGHGLQRPCVLLGIGELPRLSQQVGACLWRTKEGADATGFTRNKSKCYRNTIVLPRNWAFDFLTAIIPCSP